MRVFVTGAIAYDYLMRFPGSFRQHILAESLHSVSLSFLVEDMTKHWGGTAANIAFTMAKLGMRPILMGTAGRDFPDYRIWLEQAGVDTRAVRQHDDVFTASFFCNTDNENNQIGSFYSGAMLLAREYHLADMPIAAEAGDWVIISPNDPQAMSNLCEESRQMGLRFVYDPSQQIARMDGDTLRRDIQGAHVLIVNDYESTMVREKTGLSLEAIRAMVNILVITHGKRGSSIYQGEQQFQLEAFPEESIADPTGAGDAYRAGFMTGLVRGLPLEICGQMGSLCATYALEKVGTQNHSFTMPEYIARFRKVLDDQGALNVLLT